ncbi:MAG: Gfo/Idh/MocA family protein [Spirochaetia bacterium]
MTRWGIIGAGGIARVFANGVRFSRTGRVVAVASRTPGRGESLAEDFSIERRYTRYEDLLADRDVDAVYISLIHPLHARWAIEAARAGKHILVEKPIAMNAVEAAEMIDAARRNDVFLMEAFMYRCHPQMARLAALIAEGAIGDVRVIRATFSFSVPFDAHSRLFDPSLGGGSILDVGCYPASMSRFVAGAAAGKPFADPIRVSACGVIGTSGVDTYTAATLQFPRDIIAELVCGIDCPVPIEVTVFGTKGRLSLPNPWLPSSPVRTALKPLALDTPWPSEKIILFRSDRPEPTELVVTADRDLYTYEADTVDRHIAERQAPAMSWDDSLGNMRLLDRWRDEIRVTEGTDTGS